MKKHQFASKMATFLPILCMYNVCMQQVKTSLKNSLEMVICWHRAKIEIFLKTLEKLPGTSQVLG